MRFLVLLFGLATIIAFNARSSDKLKTVSKGKDHKCEIKKLPFLEKGCEGEMCGFTHYDYAISSFDVYSKANKKSKKTGHIKRCEKLIRITPFIKRIAFQKVQILMDNEDIKSHGLSVGDTARIYQYYGEGFLSVCVGKKKFDSEIDYFASLNDGQKEEWVKVKSQSGTEGFTPRDVKTIMWAYHADKTKLCAKDHKLRGL